MWLFSVITLRAAGVPLPLTALVGMGVRGSLNRDLTDALVLNHKADTGLDVAMLEAHSLAGGHAAVLVQAMATLAALGSEYPVLHLAALDLGGHPLQELVQAYGRSRQTYPGLAFSEVANRLIRGEDVLAMVAAGEFRPIAETDGWIVRAEVHQVRGTDVESVAQTFPPGAHVSVLRPGAEEWQAWQPGMMEQ